MSRISQTNAPHCVAPFFSVRPFDRCRPLSRLLARAHAARKTVRHIAGLCESVISHHLRVKPHLELTAVGFKPTPFRTGALSQRLRPLGQTVMALKPCAELAGREAPTRRSNPSRPGRKQRTGGLSMKNLPRPSCGTRCAVIPTAPPVVGPMVYAGTRLTTAPWPRAAQILLEADRVGVTPPCAGRAKHSQQRRHAGRACNASTRLKESRPSATHLRLTQSVHTSLTGEVAEHAPTEVSLCWEAP